MPFAEINGLQLFYHEQGPDDPEAPTIVFVHGTQGNASLWADLIDAVSGRFRCAALNHRGRPPSESPDDPSLYSIEQFADDQAAFIEQRGYRDVTMMGWSLGVRTTLAYLHRHGSGRVGQAILVAGPPSPNFGGQPSDPSRSRMRRLARSGVKQFQIPLPRRVGRDRSIRGLPATWKPRFRASTFR